MQSSEMDHTFQAGNVHRFSDVLGKYGSMPTISQFFRQLSSRMCPVTDDKPCTGFCFKRMGQCLTLPNDLIQGIVHYGGTDEFCRNPPKRQPLDSASYGSTLIEQLQSNGVGVVRQGKHAVRSFAKQLQAHDADRDIGMVRDTLGRGARLYAAI